LCFNANFSNVNLFNANTMLKKSENHNPNYLAKVVKLGKPIQHPNADRLLGWMIDGNRVWTDNVNYEEGDIVIYFPLECQINPLILSQLNLFSSSDMNFDKKQKGFFDKNGRVRAVRLRGEPSEGFILKVDTFLEGMFGNYIADKPLVFDVNYEFDTVDDCWVCKKYVPTKTQGINNKKSKSKSEDKLKDILIKDQFRFHYDTEQLKKHIDVINPDTTITITKKIHGTSGISSNVLSNVKETRFIKFIKKSLSLEKYLFTFCLVLIFCMQCNNSQSSWVIWGLYFLHIIAKIFNKKYRNFMDQLLCVPDVREYSLISASRKVIKGVNDKFTNNDGYYKFDIWKYVTNLYKDRIENGITLYFEIVGYLPDGNMIQKGYDYGCLNPISKTSEWIYNEEKILLNYKEHISFKVQIYRITYTTPQGKVIEFSWEQIKDYCRNNNLIPVKEIFTGSARAFLPIYPGEDVNVWRQAFLDKISQNYFQENDPECINKVPAEGVVIRIENGKPEAYKFKSFLFLEQESKQLDSGEIDTETEESN